MGHLLDTNILSEPSRPRPNPHVLAWLGSLPSTDGFISVITIGEVHRGIENLRRSSIEKAQKLDEWIRAIESRSDHILPITVAVSTVWGGLRQRHPNRDPIDLLIAATAMAHGLTVATRNTRDFDGIGIPLVNPFDPP